MRALEMARRRCQLELEWIITRCLKKDPERRIQHIVDVKLALSEFMRGLAEPN